jgi:hypothetical protein
MRVGKLGKTCCGLAAVLIAAGIVMKSEANFENPQLPAGLKNPGIAMELVLTTDEARGIANNPKNQATLTRLQYLDEWMFIPAYLLFFGSVGLFALAGQGWTRWFGAAVVVLVLVGAFFDYWEDYGILYALAHLNGDPRAADIAHASFRKWGSLYGMLLCLIPAVMLPWWQAATLRVVGFALALILGFTATAGLIACFGSLRPQVEAAAIAFAIPTVFFVPFVALFHDGFMHGLNWLAKIPLIGSWPEIKEPNRHRRSRAVG